MAHLQRPWENLGNPADAIRYLERRQQLNEDIDAILETCILEHRSLKAALDVVFQCMMKSLGPTVVFLRTFDEELQMRVFSNGVTAGMLEMQVPQLLTVVTPTRHTTNALDWFVLPLDMSGETIGSFGVAYLLGTAPEPAVVFDLLKVVSEELDNYFYSIQESRRKHLVIIELQKAVSHRVLRTAIDRAIQVLLEALPIQDLILVYVGDEDGIDPSVRYHLFLEGVKTFDSTGKKMPELEHLIQVHGRAVISLEHPEFERIFPIDESSEAFPVNDLVGGRRLGTLCIRPLDNAGLSIPSREILHVFIMALQQRLVDFNREQNWLHRTFSLPVTEALLRVSNYQKRVLFPRRAEIGILSAELRGLTAVCEEILLIPDRILSFVDLWSKGIVRALYEEEGVVARLENGSLLALFGPPFFDTSVVPTVTRLVRAALGIRSFTARFLELPEFKDLAKSPLKATFGLAVGLQFCRCSVGLVGPDRRYGAFGKGVDETALLQQAAQPGQILIMHQTRQIFGEETPPSCSFSGPIEIRLKDQRSTLTYSTVEG